MLNARLACLLTIVRAGPATQAITVVCTQASSSLAQLCECGVKRQFKTDCQQRDYCACAPSQQTSSLLHSNSCNPGVP